MGLLLNSTSWREAKRHRLKWSVEISRGNNTCARFFGLICFVSEVLNLCASLRSPRGFRCLRAKSPSRKSSRKNKQTLNSVIISSSSCWWKVQWRFIVHKTFLELQHSQIFSLQHTPQVCDLLSVIIPSSLRMHQNTPHLYCKSWVLCLPHCSPLKVQTALFFSFNWHQRLWRSWINVCKKFDTLLPVPNTSVLSKSSHMSCIMSALFGVKSKVKVTGKDSAAAPFYTRSSITQ